MTEIPVLEFGICVNIRPSADLSRVAAARELAGALLGLGVEVVRVEFDLYNAWTNVYVSEEWSCGPLSFDEANYRIGVDPTGWVRNIVRRVARHRAQAPEYGPGLGLRVALRDSD